MNVEISIKAKVGAASFEIESNEGDVLHHVTGPEFMKMLMDLAGYVAAPDADVPDPVQEEMRVPDYLLGRAQPVETDEEFNESSMGSVDSFIARGGRRTDIGDGQTMEEEPIFSPGSANADKPLKTFGNRTKLDPNSDDPVESRKAKAQQALQDDGGWGSV